MEQEKVRGERRDMAQFLKRAKLPLVYPLTFFEYSARTHSKDEAFASSSASSRLPVTSLQKLSHIPLPDDGQTDDGEQRKVRVWQLI